MKNLIEAYANIGELAERAAEWIKQHWCPEITFQDDGTGNFNVLDDYEGELVDILEKYFYACFVFAKADCDFHYEYVVEKIYQTMEKYCTKVGIDLHKYELTIISPETEYKVNADISLIRDNYNKTHRDCENDIQYFIDKLLEVPKNEGEDKKEE
jgi:hypothetical protein